jgi:hypothetical protein
MLIKSRDLINIKRNFFGIVKKNYNKSLLRYNNCLFVYSSYLVKKTPKTPKLSSGNGVGSGRGLKGFRLKKIPSFSSELFQNLDVAYEF